MPIEASVIPTWQAAMYSSILSIWRCASCAPRAPSLSSTSRRSRRERTSAYSAATKNAFAAIRRGTPITRSAITTRLPPLAAYFEEVRRRSSGELGSGYQRVPEPPAWRLRGGLGRAEASSRCAPACSRSARSPSYGGALPGRRRRRVGTDRAVLPRAPIRCQIQDSDQAFLPRYGTLRKPPRAREGRVDLVGAVALALPHRQHPAARARESRPPGVARTRTPVVHAGNPAAAAGGAHGHEPDPALRRARLLERHQRPAPAGARGGREGRPP